jgi:hypothetical protein
MQRQREHFGHGRDYDAIRAKLGEELRHHYSLLELPDEWLDLLQRLDARGGAVQSGATEAAPACPTAAPTAWQQQMDRVCLRWSGVKVMAAWRRAIDGEIEIDRAIANGAGEPGRTGADIAGLS